MSKQRPTPLLPTRLLAAVALVLAAGPLPAAAQWMWRDARGQFHASDLPPPRDVPAKDIVARPRGAPSDASPAAPASASAAAAASPGPAGAASAPRARPPEPAASRPAAEDPAAAGRRLDNCLRAQAQLRTIESGVRMAQINEQGERAVLDEAQRAQEALRARLAIAENCR